MDLFLSAQSMGMVAFVAAGCMVAAGAISTGLSRRRARLRQETPPASDPGAFSQGRQVAVVGRLHVDGSCCQRLEDAAPVAATSFLRDMGTGTAAWCERAGVLWLEVGGSRVELRGPVLVDVGSEEQYPAVSLDRLHASKRTYAAPVHTLPRRRGTARHGVFRSLRAGDEVVVIGMVERTADGGARSRGAGWQLVPDPSGVLVACYRRRPRIRGAFGSLQLWAAAFLD
jgi:hypothetical protein